MEEISGIFAFVILVVAVLQIILFFKIWGMTNDVRELKDFILNNSSKAVPAPPTRVYYRPVQQQAQSHQSQDNHSKTEIKEDKENFTPDSKPQSEHTSSYKTNEVANKFAEEVRTCIKSGKQKNEAEDVIYEQIVVIVNNYSAQLQNEGFDPWNIVNSMYSEFDD